MKIAEKILNKLDPKTKTDEAVKAKDIIKELIDTDWSKDNESQMKAVQLLKGIALSDEKEANAFMKKIDKFTSGMKVDEDVNEGLSGDEIIKIMRKAHVAEILDMMAAEIQDGEEDYLNLDDEKKIKKVSDFLSAASSKVAKMAK